MKKLAIIAAMVTAVTSASAVELGIRGSASDDAHGFGITLSGKHGPYGHQLGFDHFNGDKYDFNKYGFVGSYDFVRSSGTGLSVAAKAGIAAIDPRGVNIGTGVAGQVGLGFDYALTKRVKLVADAYIQKGQRKIKDTDGAYASVGLQFDL